MAKRPRSQVTQRRPSFSATAEVVPDPLVDRNLWDYVQQRLEENRTFLRGNPRQVQMLSGKTVCPFCGERTVLKHQKANGKRYRYFICGQQRKAATLTGDKPCRGDLYPVEMIEDVTIRAIREAWQKPEAIAAAQAEYLPVNIDLPDDADVRRQELARLKRALVDLKQEETQAVRAQLAGMSAGASPDVYNELFSDIAARRKDLENHRGLLASSLTETKQEQAAGHQQRVSDAVRQALKDADEVLSNPEVAGVTKRDILMELVDKVVCHKEGADVVFVPGLFESDGNKHRASNFYTTCMGMRTQR